MIASGKITDATQNCFGGNETRLKNAIYSAKQVPSLQSMDACMGKSSISRKTKELNSVNNKLNRNCTITTIAIKRFFDIILETTLSEIQNRLS
jgi:hypothetical protein